MNERVVGAFWKERSEPAFLSSSRLEANNIVLLRVRAWQAYSAVGSILLVAPPARSDSLSSCLGRADWLIHWPCAFKAFSALSVRRMLTGNFGAVKKKKKKKKNIGIRHFAAAAALTHALSAYRP